MNDRVKLTLWLGFGGILVSITVAFWSHAGFWERMFFWTATPLALLSAVMIASIVLRLQVHGTENEYGNGWMTSVNFWLTPIVTNQFMVWLVGVVFALCIGLTIASKSGHDHADTHVPSVATKIEESPLLLPDRAETDHLSDKPIPSPHTPRTPYELMEMVETKTRRDAMEHKGYWIRVEGSVQDISEVQEGGPSRHMTNEFIMLDVAVGPLPHNKFTSIVFLLVDADQWKQQVDTIERGDWLVASGVVEHVSENSMIVIDGEILSVSGPDGSTRQN